MTEWTARNGRKLKLLQGDITQIAADAIVNAANGALAGGGGVDGAIHRTGGPEIMRELDVIRARIGRCATGSAVATGAGKLPAKFVFHAVGPVYRDGQQGEAELLASCYRTCFDLAKERGVETMTMPAISTGVYAYPMREAAQVAIGEVVSLLERGEAVVREVSFVLFDTRFYEVFREELGTQTRGRYAE